jgi:hypothetical protein
MREASRYLGSEERQAGKVAGGISLRLKADAQNPPVAITASLAQANLI